MEQDSEKRYVTSVELKEQLDKIPTRWEVYTLILGAVFLNQVIPGVQIAKSSAAAIASVWP